MESSSNKHYKKREREREQELWCCRLEFLDEGNPQQEG
jgi:hypothetical protein